MAAPRYQTYKKDVSLTGGQKLGFSKGHGYYARGTGAGGGSAVADALAPLSDTQIQNRASSTVNAATSPILDQIRKIFADRSTQGQAAITGATNSLVGDLGQYMDRAKAAFGEAKADQANINAAVSSELQGGGSEVAKALSSRLGAAGLDPAMVASLAGDATATGAGSAGAAYASGSAELSKLTGESAHAMDYAAKLPGIGRLSGLQAAKQLEGQINTDLGTQVGDISSKVPGSIADLVNSMRNAEVQKQIARDSGLLNRDKATQAAGYQSQALTERQRHDQATEQAARDRIAAQKQAAADKKATAASKASETTATGKQKAFYSTRDKVFNAAKQLYKGDSSFIPPGANGSTSPSSGSAATTAEDAYAKLWQQYAVPLIAQYAFKKSVLDTMVRRALRSAGWKA